MLLFYVQFLILLWSNFFWRWIFSLCHPVVSAFSGTLEFDMSIWGHSSDPYTFFINNFFHGRNSSLISALRHTISFSYYLFTPIYIHNFFSFGIPSCFRIIPCWQATAFYGFEMSSYFWIILCRYRILRRLRKFFLNAKSWLSRLVLWVYRHRLRSTDNNKVARFFFVYQWTIRGDCFFMVNIMTASLDFVINLD